MNKLFNELEWIEAIAEQAADELDPYLDTIKNHILNLKNSEFKYTQYALFSFIPKIESIRHGMFEVAKIDEHYSFRILKRSLFEHQLKFHYLWMRFIKERNDEAGKDYFIFCKAKEDLDYIKALKDSAEMLGLIQGLSPIEILNELKPELENISSSQLSKKSGQFTYKNITKYINKWLENESENQPSFLNSIFPMYSELSSFVHGGPDTLAYSMELQDPKKLEDKMIGDLYTSQTMSFHVRASTFLIFFQDNKEMSIPFNIMNKYIKKITERESA